MDTVDISNEVIIQKVVVIISREFPDTAVSQARDCRLLNIDTLGVVLVSGTQTAPLGRVFRTDGGYFT